MAHEPTDAAATSDPDRKRDRGIALCLSGGGYRAALFHLGVLRRLNELGTLGRIETLSAVSGGSIVAAFLAQHVRPWPEPGERIANFESEVAGPLRDFTKKNIRTLWVFRRLTGKQTAAVDNLQRHYERDIVQLPLTALPDRPRFIFSATDMSFGVNWVFERDRAGSWKAGYVTPPPADWPAAKAVAASSCFPPAFEPMPVGLDPGQLTGGGEQGPLRDALVRDLALTDGGVYDNMGLEPVWTDHRVLLVSDGGATFDASPPVGMFKRVGRYLSIQGNQASSTRKRWLIEKFKDEDDPDPLRGVYFGIGSTTDHYYDGAPGYDEKLVDELISEVRTDLDYFTDAESAVLQNHGYLLADAGMREHGSEWVDGDAPKPKAPFGDWYPGFDRKALADSSKRKLLGRWKLFDGRR